MRSRVTTLIDCGVSLRGTDDFVTWAVLGTSNAVLGVLLALIFTAGNSVEAAVLSVLAVEALLTVPFVVLAAVDAAASGLAACAKTNVGAAEKASRSAAWIWR
ncbi:hypothetical protein [Paraburkholderia sp. J67]|uniref:hypothetical protein n=1 Tax=Paraburkholderia sp. J67 TaxID=2805435 RepID=UPI002ABDA6FB|nr:hypothetical protein [Paraburkholderia sp. J67]